VQQGVDGEILVDLGLTQADGLQALDNGVRDLPQTEVTNGDRADVIVARKPGSQRGRQLSIEPKNHATSRTMSARLAAK